MNLLLSEANELNDSGAAMNAYAKLQFENMEDFEREEIEAALLKYCELDTMAMVMLLRVGESFVNGLEKSNSTLDGSRLQLSKVALLSI